MYVAIFASPKPTLTRFMGTIWMCTGDYGLSLLVLISRSCSSEVSLGRKSERKGLKFASVARFLETQNVAAMLDFLPSPDGYWCEFPWIWLNLIYFGTSAAALKNAQNYGKHWYLTNYAHTWRIRTLCSTKASQNKLGRPGRSCPRCPDLHSSPEFFCSRKMSVSASRAEIRVSAVSQQDSWVRECHPR